MKPNSDGVSSGYPLMLPTACLPPSSRAWMGTPPANPLLTTKLEILHGVLINLAWQLQLCPRAVAGRQLLFTG